MSESVEAPQWSGWASGDTALYLAPLDNFPERIGLWLQVESATYLLAVFQDPRWAGVAQDWIDRAFGSIAEANRLLAEELTASR